MNKVIKTVLENGLVVLVYPIKTIPKVSVQLWYNVGSKDEKDGQRGLAHLLEHMIFKGTDIFSESDINMISHKLSGTCNAFTSYDYTCYIFDFPKQNWNISLPLLANCMNRCTFKEDLLNAELKAVIQELKMYNDDYCTSLYEKMTSTIFSSHPYHYPIIGYKQDLWNITRENLLAFYHEHYIPNNGTLVIVGDVDPDAAIQEARRAFESIKPNLHYTKKAVLDHADIQAHTLNLYRDVQTPMLTFVWKVPGLDIESSYVTQIACYLLGEGRGSRLYKKLVNEHQVATDCDVNVYDLFDAGLLFLHIDPIDSQSIPVIKQLVLQEIEAIKQNGFALREFERAQKQVHVEHLSIFESNQKIAYEIGKLFLATGKENALLVSNVNNNLEHCINQFFKTYIIPSAMHEGVVLPLDQAQKEHWLQLQEESDRLDERILSRKVRESSIECGRFVEQVTVNEAAVFEYPCAQKKALSNGLTVLWHTTKNTSKIDIILDFKVRHYYDPESKEGLINFMFAMLAEGTRDYPDQALILAAEERGITIDVKAGMIYISTLIDQMDHALEFLVQLITKPLFDVQNIQKVQQQINAAILDILDTPFEMVNQIAQSAIYQNHPFHKKILGDLETIKAITQEDLFVAFKQYISPHEARISIVGDLDNIDIVALLEGALGTWTGPRVPDLEYPLLASVNNQSIDYKINRDQTVLAYAGLSVTRLDQRYEHLLLFDQIFTGGVLGSMSSNLFALREQTGLFYTIGGSLTAGADVQPGMAYIKTIVSNDCLKQAEKLIQEAIQHAWQNVTEADIQHARNAIINTMVDNFESNSMSAQAFLFIDKFNLPDDYFQKRVHHLKKISIEEVKNSVKDIFSLDKLIKIRIGRVKA